MKDATEFVPMEVKEEPMDQQGSSSHFPSSSAGVDGVRHPERAGYLIIDSSDDLKKEVKEEPFEDHSYATLPTSSSSQQTSGAGDLRSPSRDFKEEDVWVKDEPIEEVDPLAINTTTFTPKPESTWTKDSDGQHTPHTAEGRTARLHVAAATLPQEPAADQDDSGSDTDEATQLEEHVRLKFKNIKSYFHNLNRKIQKAPSGSAAQPAQKWALLDTAMFLVDSIVDTTTATCVIPHSAQPSPKLKLGSTLPPDGTLTEGESSPLIATPEALLEIHESSLVSEPPSPECSGVPMARHSPAHGSSRHPFPVAGSDDDPGLNNVSLKHLLYKTKKLSSVTSEIDEVTESLKNYIDKKKNVSVEASSLGSLVEATFDKLPCSKQLLFMQKLVELIVEMKAIVPPVKT